MKKINVFSLMTLVLLSVSLLTVTQSCKKIPTPSMNVKIDGVEKHFIFRSTNKIKLSDKLEGIMLVATTGGAENEGEYLTLLIRGSEEKEYNLNVSLYEGAEYQCEAIYRPDGKKGTKTFKGTKGTITISSIDDKYISGTFNFEAMNSILDSEKVTIVGDFDNLRYFSASLKDLQDVFND